ncbi:MAG: cobyric acid synthase [Solirubrobacteraceae bacterium]
MSGGLLVAGTGSDAGKSVVAAGICRWLRRRGVRAAPFKAQNMALNSAVTASGAEIGRAQAAQAQAAGVAPEPAMNPILIKPSGERFSQVMLMGRPLTDVDARGYQGLKAKLFPTVLEALESLRSRFDVVVCEGAGSPAEINLRRDDLTNMGLARAAGLPVVLVGDIDRGGVFASLFGTLALLDAGDQRLVGGFLINKFRGDRAVLDPGLDALRELTGRPTLGVLPWLRGLWLDVEDSLALEAPRDGARPPVGPHALEVAVVRLRWMSNFTDFDALAAEPGVIVRFTQSAADVERADLVILPGTKATVEDLSWLRERALDGALVRRARTGGPLLGICGGYQMLGSAIRDDVESGAGEVVGLGLLPIDTEFVTDKLIARSRGRAAAFGGHAVEGFEIHHGRVRTRGGRPLFDGSIRGGEGCRRGAVLGTSWHGVLECDGFRRALLSWVAAVRRRRWTPGDEPFAAVRERRLDALGDLIEHHADTEALLSLIERAPAPDLPSVAPVVAA